MVSATLIVLLAMHSTKLISGKHCFILLYPDYSIYTESNVAETNNTLRFVSSK